MTMHSSMMILIMRDISEWLSTFYQLFINFDAIFGPAYKGIPLATAVGITYFEKTNKKVDLVFDRKETKDHTDDTIQKIIDVLDTKIRPAVARDGGDIKFKSFKNGVVKVELQGSCSG